MLEFGLFILFVCCVSFLECCESYVGFFVFKVDLHVLCMLVPVCCRCGFFCDVSVFVCLFCFDDLNFCEVIYFPGFVDSVHHGVEHVCCVFYLLLCYIVVWWFLFFHVPEFGKCPGYCCCSVFEFF